MHFYLMNVGLFKTEGTVIKFSKKEKKKGGGGGVQSCHPLISAVCLLFRGGEGLGRLCGRWHKKKIHQLRIWSPPLKVYLNNMFQFCLKPLGTTSAPRIHHYLGSWAIKDDTFCYIMNCSVVWTKVTFWFVQFWGGRISTMWEKSSSVNACKCLK